MTTVPHIARTRIVIATGIVAAAVVVLVFVPIRIPRDATVYGRVLPAREWVLVRTAGGQLQALLRGNETGAIEEYTVAEPLRGDAMQFQRAPAVAEMHAVAKGDTLGWVFSPELARQLTELEGTLDVARATLAAARSGEKPALVEEARALLARARASWEEQKNLHARQKELHEREIISAQEYQLSADRLAVLRAGVEAAEAQLAAATSGLKAEDVRERERAVAALEADIAALRTRLSSHTYVAPISGTLHGGFTGDTLLALRDSETLLLLPVGVDDCAQLRDGAPVTFEVPGTGLHGSARIRRVHHDVQYLQGAPVCFVVAEIADGEGDIHAGLIARAAVPCRTLTLREYLGRLWRGLFH